jgi:GNAT superfamily N-acetyltransferase
MITLRSFDPRNAGAADWAAFHAVRRVLFVEDAPERRIPGDEHVEKHHRLDADPQWQSRWWLAFEGDLPVGRLQVATRHGEDPGRYAGRVFVFGGVVPSHRRQGIATRMARHLLALMRDENHLRAVFPLSSVALGGPFLERLGAQLLYREVDNRLLLAHSDPAAFAAHVDAVPSHLRWEEHVGRVPLDRLRALALQINRLLADVPREDLDHPPPLFEVASYEALYRRMEELGGAHLLVMLFAADELVAVCESAVHATSPALAVQRFTGVARHWRGHGLGLAVKARTLQLVRERHPAVTEVHTSNAATNAPMLRVNAQLGFRAHRESGVFEVEREELERSLSDQAARS